MAGGDIAEIGIEQIMRKHHGEAGLTMRSLLLLTLSTADFMLS